MGGTEKQENKEIGRWMAGWRLLIEPPPAGGIGLSPKTAGRLAEGTD
jgi:hypothetical protein